MQSNNDDSLSAFNGFFRAQLQDLILDQNQRFHRMVKSQFMLSKLGQNGTNIKMYLSGIWNAQSLANRHITGRIDAPVFEFESHFEVGERISQLVALTEVAREVVVRGRAEPLVVLGEQLGFFKQFEREFRVVRLKALHSDHVALQSDFRVNCLKLISIYNITHGRFEEDLALIETTKSFHVSWLFF